ncbi:MAG: Ig-like domain-containing protein, partial [Halioglobus sp.]
MSAQLYSYDVAATDEDGDLLAYSLDVAPTGMTIDPDSGLIQWTPTLAQAGANAVAVRVEDGNGGVASQQFTITVSDENRAPVAVDDFYSVVSGNLLAVPPGGVLENDSDPDGDPLTAQSLSLPQNGDLTLHSDGSFDYLPRRPPTPDGDRRFVVNENLSILAVPNFIPPTGTRNLGWPERSADGNLETSWAGGTGGYARVLEHVFEAQDIAVRQVRIFGNRQHADFSVTTEAIVRLFDHSGTELWSSGALVLGPNGDLEVDVIPLVENVYRVQFEPTAYDGSGANLPALAEFQVFGDGFVQELPMGLEWSWTGEGKKFPNHENVLNTPLVADLNADGHPEIVFAGTVRTGLAVNPGFLRAVDGRDGSNYFETSQCVDASTTMAIADIDGDGFPEIVASMTSPYPADNPTTCVGNGVVGLSPKIIAFEHDGTVKWVSDDLDRSVKWGGIAVADLDADGTPEIIFDSQVFDNEGHLLWKGSQPALGGGTA